MAVPQARHRRVAGQPADAVRRRAPPAAPLSDRQGRARVLVVDDEASIRDLLSKTLALAEYDVDTAADASTALDRVRASEYDLLIADLRMPGMDGLTLIRQVKRIRAELPVIIITGFSTESSAIEAVNLGVAGYLTQAVPRARSPRRRRQGARSSRRIVRSCGSIDPAFRPHQIVRRPHPARPRHLADRRRRSCRPVRAERRRQDDAAQDAGADSTSRTPAASSSRRT